ncbi:GtrA family protein [Pseudomonas sp. 8AS]|uniref:GtrA family protein n=1 Tax=Pseudomonas sp. 8AS TaxID=2653163 RepID=UPI0012F4440C|nr:GtrA family protein [Pseudomonas sp. 8AS]VXC05961.1 GtrA family protein [Pseudomonas sp. 8AS]
MNWRQLLSSEFLRFLFAGGIAAAANYGSRFFFSLFFEYSLAIICAYLVGMLVAFLLMRRHVFDAKSGSLLPQALKFIAVNLLAALQTLVISLLLARWALPSMDVVEHSEAIAHLVGVLVPVLTSYFGHKHLTFH